MTRSPVSALALASLCACAGAYTNGSTPISPIDGGGSGHGGGSADGGDGGADGGADAGVDAGCVPVSLNGLGIIDTCLSSNPPETGTASLSVADAGCAVGITLSTSSAYCTGVASGGSANAFTGTCGSSKPCTSPSLPGLLTCSSGGSSCTIEICDAGTCP